MMYPMADGAILSSDLNAVMFHVTVESLLEASDVADRDEAPVSERLQDDTARNHTADDDDTGQG